VIDLAQTPRLDDGILQIRPLCEAPQPAAAATRGLPAPA
jgi:hypothetical protein